MIISCKMAAVRCPIRFTDRQDASAMYKKIKFKKRYTNKQKKKEQLEYFSRLPMILFCEGKCYIL